jgi:hypothetical protein
MKKIAFVILAVVSVVLIARPAFTPESEQSFEEAQPRVWSKVDSKTYAKDRLMVWVEVEWKCLERLWGKESAWRPSAYNEEKVGGRNAGGIPQLLGLDPKTAPTIQIERGLSYIYHRYETPCNAWKHWKKKKWY